MSGRYEIEADGMTIEISLDTPTDIKLSVNDGEEVWMSPDTARLIAVALVHAARAAKNEDK